jgi:hypothetical protein
VFYFSRLLQVKVSWVNQIVYSSMNDQETTTAAILKVGEGRGFVVESANQRLVITTAHCLPYPPPCASMSQSEEHTYQKLLGHIGGVPEVWAECLFADPISDIAVLGRPDDYAFYEESEAYEVLTASMTPLAVAHAPNRGTGWIPSLDGHWFQCEVRHRNGPLWIVRAAKEIKGTMSGSPIVDNKCSAIAVLCAIGGISGEQNREGGPNPRLARNLPGWLLQELHC